MGFPSEYKSAADLDGVHRADRDARDGDTRANVAAYLEEAHWYGITHDRLRWGTQLGQPDGRRHCKQAIESDESELDECESDWVAKLVQ